LPGRCWETLNDVYCRVNGIKSVIAKLGGGHDSFLAEKNLQVAVDGGPGDDMIFGGKKNDRLIGGLGRDNLTGEGGNDVISGGAGNDSLNGDTWRDPVFFRPYAKPAGRDRIDGGAGADGIQGGAGPDVLLGGPGNDSFYNNRDRARDRMLAGAGRDSVHDPDVSRAGNGVAILDRISGFEFLYLGFRQYRLK
jgi:Ca2+-binding RTX toxin-like protein